MSRAGLLAMMGGSASFVGQQFSDNFNRADSDDLGLNWTAVAGGYRISNQQAWSDGGTDISVWTDQCDTRNNFSQATLASSSGSNGVIARATGNTYYLWRATNTSIGLYAVISNVAYTLVPEIDITPNWGTDVVRLECSGTTITGYLNGVILAQVEDARIISGRNVGMRTIGGRLDDWSGGDISGPLPTTFNVEYLAWYYTLADSTQYTFSSVDFGSPSPNRTIIIAINARSGSAPTVTGVTIGEVTATVDNQRIQGGNLAGVASASVPSGSVGDVVVSFSGVFVRGSIGVFVTDHAVSVMDAQHSVTSGVPLSMSVVSGGFMIGSSSSSSEGSVAFSGLEAVYNNLITEGSNSVNTAAGMADTPTTGSQDVIFQWTPNNSSQAFSLVSYA